MGLRIWILRHKEVFLEHDTPCIIRTAVRPGIPKNTRLDRISVSSTAASVDLQPVPACFQRRDDGYANVYSRITILSIRPTQWKTPLASWTRVARGSTNSAYDALNRLDVEVRVAGRGLVRHQRCDANSNRFGRNSRLHYGCKKELDSECGMCMLRVGDRMGRVTVTSADRIIAHLRQVVSGILCASDEGCPYEVTTTEAEETVRTEPQGALSWTSN